MANASQCPLNGQKMSNDDFDEGGPPNLRAEVINSEAVERSIAREACMRDIEHHIKTVGPHEWKMVMARHPMVSERMFYRYVARARGMGASKAKVFTPEPDTVRDAIKHLAQRAQTAAMKENIPHPPSPAIIAMDGLDARRKLDFLCHVHEMLGDCDLLREWSLRRDEDGTVRVHNPMYFSKAINQRGQILEIAIAAMKALWDIQRMQKFYDQVVEEVAKENPDTGRRLMMRLQELDNERGMTMNAQV